MKKFTKALSVVLAVMMIMCTISALSFSASAAEANKVSLTSNVGKTVSYDYSADSTKVTVTYKLQSSMLIENIQAVVSYDSSVLSLASSNTKKTISPVFYGSNGGGFEANLGLSNTIKFNATSPDGYDFSKGAVVFTAVFDIIGQGSTAVDLDVYVLTGTKNNQDIKMIYRDEVINNNFTLTASGSVETPTPGSTTIYFAAPQGTASKYTWENIQLYYGNTTSIGSTSRINMVDTGNTVNVSSVGNATKIVTGNWKVYKAELTDEQVAAIDASTVVGFVNKANTNIRTGIKSAYAVTKAGADGKYSSTAKSIADFDGQTFVISGCYYTPSEASTYIGSWKSGTETDATTVYFAAPKGTESKYTWSNIQLYYGTSESIGSTTRINMVATGDTIKVSSVGNSSKIVAGDWKVYKAELTDAQVTAIDAATVVGFVNAANTNIRTGIKSAYAITKAGADGKYSSTAKSIADFDGQTFVISGCYYRPSEASTYIGSWKNGTETDATTVYFAAPNGTASKYTWSNIQLYYGTSESIGSTTRINMVDTGKTVNVSSVGNAKKIVTGNWKVYKAELTKEQVAAIDASTVVGFVNKSNTNIRTGIKSAYAITKAGAGSKYSSTAKSIADFDGKTFVISGCYYTPSEAGTYIGSWK